MLARYWRLRILSKVNNASNVWTGFAELSFRSSLAGSNLLTTNGLLAYGSGVTNVLDANPSTYWSVSGGYVPDSSWIGHDFGSPVAITHITASLAIPALLADPPSWTDIIPTILNLECADNINFNNFTVVKQFTYTLQDWSSNGYIQELQAVPPTLAFLPESGSFQTSQDITITATPGAVIYFTLDGTIPTELSSVYTAPITVSNTVIKAIAVKDAMISDVYTATYIIDTQAPVLTCSKTSGVYNTPITVSLSLNEAGIIYYTLDGSIPSTTSLVYSTELDFNSAVVLKVLGVDLAGNESSIETYNFSFDFLAPIITCTPATGSYKQPQLVEISVNEAATVRYKLDSGNWQNYFSPVLISANCALTAEATDLAGNIATKTENFIIDTLAPIIGITPQQGKYTVLPKVQLLASEPSALYYTLDGTTPTEASQVYTEPLQLTNSTVIKFFAKDLVGNNSEIQTHTFSLVSSGQDLTALEGFMLQMKKAYLAEYKICLLLTGRYRKPGLTVVESFDKIALDWTYLYPAISVGNLFTSLQTTYTSIDSLDSYSEAKIILASWIQTADRLATSITSFHLTGYTQEQVVNVLCSKILSDVIFYTKWATTSITAWQLAIADLKHYYPAIATWSSILDLLLAKGIQKQINWTSLESALNTYIAQAYRSTFYSRLAALYNFYESLNLDNTVGLKLAISDLKIWYSGKNIDWSSAQNIIITAHLNSSNWASIRTAISSAILDTIDTTKFEADIRLIFSIYRKIDWVNAASTYGLTQVSLIPWKEIILHVQQELSYNIDWDLLAANLISNYTTVTVGGQSIKISVSDIDWIAFTDYLISLNLGLTEQELLALVNSIKKWAGIYGPISYAIMYKTPSILCKGAIDQEIFTPRPITKYGTCNQKLSTNMSLTGETITFRLLSNLAKGSENSQLYIDHINELIDKPGMNFFYDKMQAYAYGIDVRYWDNENSSKDRELKIDQSTTIDLAYDLELATEVVKLPGLYTYDIDLDLIVTPDNIPNWFDFNGPNLNFVFEGQSLNCWKSSDTEFAFNTDWWSKWRTSRLNKPMYLHMYVWQAQGTVSIEMDNLNLIGSGTNFLRDLQPNQYVKLNGELHVIDVVVNAELATLRYPATVSVIDKQFFSCWTPGRNIVRRLRIANSIASDPANLQYFAQATVGDRFFLYNEYRIIEEKISNNSVRLADCTWDISWDCDFYFVPKEAFNKGYITNTISLNSSMAVTGIGTQFLADFSPGIFLLAELELHEVTSVESNQALTLATSHTVTKSNVKYWSVSTPLQLTGTLTIIQDQSALTGVNTLFLTELQIGDLIALNGSVVVIQSIESNLAATVTIPAAVTSSNVVGKIIRDSLMEPGQFIALCAHLGLYMPAQLGAVQTRFGVPIAEPIYG